MTSPSDLIVILGPTASGKTRLAVALAKCTDGEVISADSRQVYRHMDIGTGKDLSEYKLVNQTIPYHLIDICEPGEQYNLNAYQQDFSIALTNIQSRRKQPILCGGSGLYIQAVLESYQLTSVPENITLRIELDRLDTPELVERLASLIGDNHFTPDTSTRKRTIRAIEIAEHLKSKGWKIANQTTTPAKLFGLQLNREIRRKRISERLKYRLENGLIEEVQRLIKMGIPVETLIRFGLEYKFVTRYLFKKLNREELFNQLEIAIHQFAKRQMTWFRKMEREGYAINWIDAQESTEKQVKEIVDKSCG